MASKVIRGSSPETTLGYTGQHLDDTGLLYYNARYYDPGVGKFVNPDTIVPNAANPQAFNRYGYAYNNPLRFTDPTGHYSKPVLKEDNDGDGGTYYADGEGNVTSTPSTQYTPADTKPAPNPPNILERYGNVDPFAFLSQLRPAQGGTLGAPVVGPAPSFIGTPDGELILVPKGATGPYDAFDGKGDQYVKGQGGPGINEKTTGVRIADPKKPIGKIPGYPNGHVQYTNETNQKINPFTGRTVADKDAAAHFSLKGPGFSRIGGILPLFTLGLLILDNLAPEPSPSPRGPYGCDDPEQGIVCA